MFSRILFVVSLSFLIFVAIFAFGFAAGNYQIWPFSLIDEARQIVASLREFGAIHPLKRVVVAPPDAPRKRIVIYDPAQQMKGLYVFLGWDDASKQFAAWLYDDTGKQLFTWPLNYKHLDPDGPSNRSDMPHPFAVLPDGSLIVGFDKGDVMVRIDSCGEPMWTKRGIYHHSVTRADDGSFWTWRGEGTPYGHYQYIENFDGETGKPIREIALVEDVIQKLGTDSMIFGVRPDYDFKHFTASPEDVIGTDIFHPNDVDILPAAIAQKFPAFEAGDLLISLLELNLVAVLDPDTRQLKWWSHGPWRFQHDPDFTDDGRISVLSNNRLPDNRPGRSEIIKMEPATRQVSNELFGGEFRFYTGEMGTHQYLPNGNLMVVSPWEGRIVEVSGSGKKVMEFNNLSRSAKYNAHVENAQWVPADYFSQAPSCHK